MKIQPIVEGHGEVEAIPVLLRRFRDAAQAFQIDVNMPIRRHRSDLTEEARLRLSIRIALEMNCQAILVIFDADDDCPKTKAPQLQTWASNESGSIPCFVVMANREYESWLLSAIESLRGIRGILLDASRHPDPESPRDAKGQLTDRMPAGKSYSPAVDQAALTARFDMADAYSQSRSFRRLVKVFGLILENLGLANDRWPPEDWSFD
jgi:Domain of unknown function (DUF4276)